VGKTERRGANILTVVLGDSKSSVDSITLWDYPKRGIYGILTELCLPQCVM
jgi:hypothetical protein